jgi:hypothetical protein
MPFSRSEVGVVRANLSGPRLTPEEIFGEDSRFSPLAGKDPEKNESSKRNRSPPSFPRPKNGRRVGAMPVAPDPLAVAKAEFARTREETKRLHREFVKAPHDSELRKQLGKKHGDAARAHQKAANVLQRLLEPETPKKA